MSEKEPFYTLRWSPTNHCLNILDQTKLPTSCTYIALHTEEDVYNAIKDLKVRGAPAIGVAAAYGVVLGMQKQMIAPWDPASKLDTICDYLITARPTAVNLAWAVNRMRKVGKDHAKVNPQGEWPLVPRLLGEANEIFKEDTNACKAIGDNGLFLLTAGSRVLTHCNAGALATTKYGTALAPIYRAAEKGQYITVFVDETRPVNQGARLTLWELSQAKNVHPILVTDSMAACLMQMGRVDVVLVGADRIAENGDTANKIGTLGLAIIASYYKVPFYVCAPVSTFDFGAICGTDIQIETRSKYEVLPSHKWPPDISYPEVYNPAFDRTDASLITGYITEVGVIIPNLGGRSLQKQIHDLQEEIGLAVR